MTRFRPFAFCLAVAACAAAALWPLLGGGYRYGEFIVGAISWRNDNKAADYYALLVVVAVFLVLAGSFRKLQDRLRHVPEAGVALEHLVGLALLPLALWLGAAVVTSAAPGYPYSFAVAAAALLGFGGWLAFTVQRLDRDAIAGIGGRILLSLLLAFFAGAGVVLLVVLVSNHTLPATPHGARAVIGTVLILNAVVVGNIIARSHGLDELVATLRRWLVLLQFPLPLLGLVLVPAQLVYRGAPEPFAWPWLLLVVLAALAAWTWVRLARRYRNSEDGVHWLDRTVDALPLALIAVFLTSPQATFDLLAAPGYPTLFGDDFHMGEQILPWQQWIDFHRIPYVDFAPVHGLMPLATGALNAIFFDGTLANLNASFGLLVALSAALTIALAYRNAGIMAGLVLCFILSSFDRLLFVAPALLLVTDVRLLARPARWIVVWAAMALFMVGYNPAAGPAFVLGTLPIAAWMLARKPPDGRPARSALVLVLAGTMIVVGLVPHVYDAFAGLVAFIAENAAANMVRHGVPFAHGLGLPGHPADGVFASRVLFECFRLAWIAVALYALVAFVADWQATRRGRLPSGTAALPLAAGLTLLFLAAWSMGRIDAEYASRVGPASFLAVGTLLPVLYLRRGGPPFAAMFPFALVVAMFAAMVGVQDRFSPAALAVRAYSRVEVPAKLERLTSADAGGGRVGTLFVPAERKAQVASFDDALRHVLVPGQTYFDLTNRQALYFYRGLPVPALYSATYNVLTERQQQRVLRQLAAAPPTAALIAPALAGDAVDASLRSYYLYRHFVRGYRPVAFGPWTFLVNASSPAFPRDADRARDDELLARAFAHPDLQLLPATWGRNWPALAAKARFLGDFALATSGVPAESRCVAPEVSIGRFQPPPSAPAVPDLLEIRLHPAGKQPATLSVKFAPLPGGQARAIAMEVRGDRLVVPVGASPAWLTSAGTPVVELCAPAGTSQATELIAGIGAWSIPDPAF